MSRVVIAWELGAGLGHVTRLKVLADELNAKGHTITFVSGRGESLKQLYSENCPIPYQILETEIWPDKRVKLSREPANLSEILLSLGYHNPSKLQQQIKGWQKLLDGLRPDVIIYDYAPTAILASRKLACKKIGLDIPFSKPPPTSPLPAVGPTPKVSTNNLALSENKLVGAVNQALQINELPPITQAHEIFETHVSFLLTIPELDPFAPMRKNSRYVGAIETAVGIGGYTPWHRRRPTKKVFGYLKPSYPKLEEFLATLAQRNDIEGRFFIPGCSQRLLKLFEDSAISISAKPLNVTRTMRDCDLTVCHAGHSTVLQSALAGIPVLVIPLHQEQLATAQRVIDIKLGHGLAPDVGDSTKIQRLISRLLDDVQYRTRAEAIAQKYSQITPSAAISCVVDAVEN